MMHDKRADVWHLHAYVVDHGADHEDECPGDDTCDCLFAERNAAVNRLIKALITEPYWKRQQEPPRAS